MNFDKPIPRKALVCLLKTLNDPDCRELLERTPGFGAADMLLKLLPHVMDALEAPVVFDCTSGEFKTVHTPIYTPIYISPSNPPPTSAPNPTFVPTYTCQSADSETKAFVNTLEFERAMDREG